jgi:hypothetical protein
MAITIITRKQARAQGLSRYFTGKACKQGHLAERSTRHADCIECVRLKNSRTYWRDPARDNARRKASRQASPEKAKAYSRLQSAQWKRKNPEKVNAQNRAWREKYPEKVRLVRERWDEKHKDRMQNDPEYAAKERTRKLKELWQRREKKADRPCPDHCEICGGRPKEICFDHCHQTGKFRGWLCHQCNQILGLSGDSPDLLRQLAHYLEKHLSAGNAATG